MIREYQRFEGASDPDDTSIVYAIEGQGGGGHARVPWLVGPPAEMLERNPARALPRFGHYRHGYPVPVPQDPWSGEGGESGPAS